MTSPQRKFAEINDVVELAKQLINVKSVTKNEYQMALALKSWLEARDFIVELQFVADSNRYNVLSYPTGTDPKTAKILINSHIDTVPPYFGPAEIKNNRIYGRGACDTKSILAAQLIAVNNLIKNNKINKKDIALLYTVGEEVDSIGMYKANQLNLNPKFLIVGEPTESRTIAGQKGSFIIELKSKGIAAHSAYPEKGQCALTPLLNILTAIKNEKWPKDKLFGDTTVNIWIDNGGIASNVIPAFCSAKIQFRVSIQNTKYIDNKIKTFIKKFDIENQIKYEKLHEHGPIILETVNEKYNPYIVSYTTDIPAFDNVMNGNCKAVLFGPGSITVAHSDHEYMDIHELKQSINTYQEIILDLLQRCQTDKVLSSKL